MPRGLRDGSERGPVLGMDFSESEIVVTRKRRSRIRELGRILRGSEVGVDGAIATRVNALSPSRTRVRVSLPVGLVLRKQLDLPEAAEENLREVLSFEMERQTPFRADEVYFNYALVARRPQEHQIRVDLQVVPRRVVREALDLVENWDLRSAPSEARVDPATGKIAFTFEPAAYDATRGRGINLVLVVLNLGLLTALVGLPLSQQYRHLGELRQALESAKVAANAASETQRLIEAKLAEARFLFDKKRQTHLTVEVLDELSKRLPDGTWLRRLELKGQDASMDGESDAASSSIAQLESSPIFSNVRFVAPVTQDPRSGKERFRLAARVDARLTEN